VIYSIFNKHHSNITSDRIVIRETRMIKLFNPSFCFALKKCSVLLVILLSSILVSCGGSDDSRRHRPSGNQTDPRKPLSWGHEQTIYVFADDRVWYYAEQYLRESIERYYFTTENETYFDLKRGDFSSLDLFYRFKNLIFLAHLDSDRHVSNYIKQNLTENVIQSVNENGVGMFIRHNLWANDQLVLFLVGDTEANLLRYNILQADEVFQQFREKLYARTASRIFGFNVHPVSLFRNFPWNMKIPEYYIVYKRNEADNFISFLARRREQPDRYLSVYYEDMPENNLDIDWLFTTRERLAWQYYDEDEFRREDTRSEVTDLVGINALKLSGRWQNRKHAIGGAFQSFAFYDDIGKRAYLIDNSVFYPEGFKLPALIELEVISRTIDLEQESEALSAVE